MTALTLTSQAQPMERPTRIEMLTLMLDGTHRGGAPIRRSFLQTRTPHSSGTRAGKLSRLVRDVAALDAYLLISAMASSSEPYDTWYPSSTWAQVTMLDRYAEQAAAKARWSKAVRKLKSERLMRHKRVGNKMNYILLDESGSGEEYARPTKVAHGTWFSIPHFYWTQEFDDRLSLPGKVMLLISLDQQDNFRMPTDRAPSWYGISESTARRGFEELLDLGILARTSAQKADPKAPNGWKTELRYTTAGDWSLPERKKLMTRSRRRKPSFTPPNEDNQ
jgi:hypothetical protein